MALPFYAFTLFVSAFLLFLVQPIIGKTILPSLGGAPQVWNTCMVFFQAALLAGYAYTHTTSTRLSLRNQLLIHAVLLFIPFAFLLSMGRPFNITWWQPPSGANPIPSTLFLLFVIVGIPFFVVATSAPLLQKWFVHTGHPAAKDPYFLYAASNIGSMGALLAYPFLIEPLIGLSLQSWFWTAGYIVLLGMVLFCASMVWKPAAHGSKLILANEPAATTNPVAADASTAIQKPSKLPHAAGKDAAPGSADHDEITPMRRLRWIALAAVPTSLMLGITTHFTTDLSPVPLFWLIPLTLYLLTFILVFARWPVVWTGLPHTIILYLQPFLLIAMIYQTFIESAGHALEWPIFIYCIGFFLTTMVCHGELARDRPSPKHLTEFYLMMSLGGVIGGIFNGLVAPVFFTFGAWEFPIAIVLAGLLRPNMQPDFIELIVNSIFAKPAHKPAPVVKKPAKGKTPAKPEVVKSAPADAQLIPPLALDIGLPILVAILCLILARSVIDPRRQTEEQQAEMAIAFLLPLAISCLFLTRGLRFGLSIGLIMLIHYLNFTSAPAFRDRSYFGVISVHRSAAAGNVQMPGSTQQVFTKLLHGSTDHGMNFLRPTDKALHGNPNEDFSRLQTTYYHRLGPVGLAMDKFTWFGDKLNTYDSDSRIPASLVGMGANSFGALGVLADTWSEPPYAVIGLGTGTMAAYAKPLQHCHFYEIDNHILRLSLPIGDEPWFNYLRDARDRGAQVQVLMGDARLRMAKPYAKYDEDVERAGDATYGGPEHFYRLMVVDAFSSDAIPMHLLTKEAFEMYFKKLAPDGILAVHTSNRHVDLPKVVADVVAKVEVKDPYTGKIHHLVAKRGDDESPPGMERDVGMGGRHTGHYNSEWVMVFRDDTNWTNDLENAVPGDYLDKRRKELEKKHPGQGIEEQVRPYWDTPPTSTGFRHVWTDDYSNIMDVLKNSTAISMLVRLFVTIIVGVGIIILITKTSKHGDIA